MNCPECGAESKVLGSKNLESMTVVYRRRVCGSCDHRFSSVEVTAAIWGSLRERVQRSTQAIVNRRWIVNRNAQIKRRYEAGEKQAVLACEFGLSPGSVSQIVNRKRGLK